MRSIGQKGEERHVYARDAPLRHRGRYPEKKMKSIDEVEKSGSIYSF